ncbi:MAG: GIY-YIG nuclease family protein [Ferruginibacter sp.]
MVHIYVLYSHSAQKYYVGMTKNLQQRIKEHNAGKSTFTAAYKPWILIYSETEESYSTARIREKYLKSAAGKKFVEKVINKEE